MILALRYTLLLTLSGPGLIALQVTLAEKKEAPAVVAAEGATADRAARERRRCLILVHMTGLLKCHAEFREALLRSAGRGTGRGFLVSADGKDQTGQRVWRQHPAVGLPIHQVLHFVYCFFIAYGAYFVVSGTVVVARR